ncbi:MAG: efflux RND transporter periplasmic adaptor subunit [Polyangiales bacterium]
MSAIPAPTVRRFRPGRLLVAALLVGFGVLVLTRYREAVAERASFAAAGTTTAPSVQPSVAAQVSRPAARVRPVAAQWQPSVDLTGTLAPLRDSSVSFKVTGRLASVLVKVGDMVKAGQRLATLDPAEASAQLAAANAQVHAADVELAIAQDNERRSQALSQQGAISATQHLTDQQHAELAQARLEQARAQTQTAAAALQNTQLLAPFAGLVVQAPSAPGAIVMTTTPLFRLLDASTLRLNATVSADDAALLRLGQSVQVEGGRRGRITAILPSVDEKTRRVPLVAEIDNRGPSPLLAGVFVRATVSAGAPIDVLRVPATALRPGSQDELVLVNANRARLARVTFSRDADGSLLVRKGLLSGDEVLLAPSSEVKDGDELQPPPSTTAP